MFPHRATGFLPFKMLYGREAIWFKEISYVLYNCDETYLEAVENHICNIIKIHEMAIKKNRGYQKQMTKNFAKKVTKSAKRDYKVGEIVWVDVRRQMRANQRGMVKWVGPYKTCRVEKGPLYYIKYWTKSLLIKFNIVYPQFIKTFCRKSG